MEKMRVISWLVISAIVICASACASVDKNYVNQVTGEYKLTDTSWTQLIESGTPGEKIKGLEKAYILEDGQRLVMEYRDTVPMYLEPSLKNKHVFITRDTIPDIDKIPDFKVEFILSDINRQATNSRFNATFSSEAAKHLGLNTADSMNLEYHRAKPITSDTQAGEPWIRVNENTPQVDVSKLEAIAHNIRSGKYGAVHSILVIKDGYLVLEEYFRGSNANHLHPMASATKSVTSAIIGIAVDQGLISEDQRVVEFFKDYTFKNMSEKKSEITVKNLLTMRHGLAWKQGPPFHYDWRRMFEKDDYVQFVLDKPMRHQPGTVWNYSNGASVLLGAIIEEATGYSYMDFADKFLFTPIGITSCYLGVQDRKGHPESGGYLKMTARDMARFGLLVLNNGEWEGRQVISTPYLQRSFKAYSDDVWLDLDYGYHWWMLPINIQGRSTFAIKASGHGGQQIWILPRLSAVVVFTAWGLQPRYIETLNDLLKFEIIEPLAELSFPVNKTAVSRILPDDAVDKIEFNQNEPWTGKWKVESSSQGSGIWAMKQTGKIVKSTADSAYDFKGKVQGDQLKGNMKGASSGDLSFTVEMHPDAMAFKGIYVIWGRSYQLKGRRIE